VFDAAAATVPPAYVVLAILSAASMVVRFRRSRGIERQQLKWFTYGAVATMVGYVLSVLTGLVGLPPVLSWITGDIWLAAGPIAIGVAVLHYRLYDIDHLISRTVAYGLLTVLLGAVYAGLGLVLGQLFGGLRGSPPSWAVAIVD
jgi:amino acid transporter